MLHDQITIISDPITILNDHITLKTDHITIFFDHIIISCYEVMRSEPHQRPRAPSVLSSHSQAMVSHQGQTFGSEFEIGT